MRFIKLIVISYISRPRFCFKYFLLLVSIVFIQNTKAQNNRINPTTQSWSEIDLLGNIGKKWKWQTDIQYSRQSAYEDLDFIKYNEQLTLRGWLHYYVVPTIKLSTFYGLWYNYAINEVGAREYPEYRTALQIQFYKFFGRNMVSNRFRSEFREIRDIYNEYEFVVRGRYMLKYQRLINSNSYNRGALYFIGFNEVFINGGSKVTGYKPFDQNRVFMGIGYNLTNNLTVETGYFNQFVHHAHNVNFDTNHIFQLSLIVTDLTN